MLPAGAKLLAQGRFGKLRREITDGKSRLVPDARKGVLRAIRTEDGLMHLMWAERADGGAGVKDEAEDDVIVFPEEAAFSQIPGQRAAALKFVHEPDRNSFFWIQEPAEAGDAALVTRINAVINTPMGADDDVAMEDTNPLPGSAAPQTDALLRGALAA